MNELLIRLSLDRLQQGQAHVVMNSSVCNISLSDFTRI